MDWVWQDGRVINPHTGHCFDLPGMNFSDVDGYTSFARQAVVPVQLGKVDLADDDQLFHLVSLPGLGTPPAFEPLTAETSELQHKPESDDRPGFFPSCPDGCAGERHFCPSEQRGLAARAAYGPLTDVQRLLLLIVLVAGHVSSWVMTGAKKLQFSNQASSHVLEGPLTL